MTVLGRDTSERLVDCAAVQGFVRRVCFKTGPPGLVGTELEWIVAFADDPTRPVPLSLLRDLLDAAGPPPRGSRVTYEQVAEQRGCGEGDDRLRARCPPLPVGRS